MKKIACSFILIMSVQILLAQVNDSSDVRDKRAESRIRIFEYKYISGEYKEAESNAGSLVKKLDKKSLPSYYKIKAKLIQAYSLYALFKFSEAEDQFMQAVSIADSENDKEFKLVNYLELANYRQETGDLVASLSLLAKAEAFAKGIALEKHSQDFNFIKAKIFLKQGLENEALELLEQQKASRLESASSFNVNGNDKTSALNIKANFKQRKEKYAGVINLKIACLIAKGMFREAEALIENNKVWIASNLGKDHILMREALEFQAGIYMKEGKYQKASLYYSDAYVCTSFPEYECQKMKDLSQLVIACIYSGQTVKYNNYLRRLEMYAFRNVGFIDPFQLSFEYTESYKSFIEGDYTSAVSRINRLAGAFDFLPSSHAWNVDIIKLKAAIAAKRGDIKTYKESLKQIADIKQKFYGEQSPDYNRSRLALAMYEINYGKDFATAETIMKSSYDGMLKNELVGESIENINYLTAYASLFARTGRYDSAMAKAKLATGFAKSVYDSVSAEYLLELSRFTEFQIMGGKYKEGFDNLQKLSGLSEKLKGGDEDVLREAYMNLARLYNLKGEFDKSQVLLNRAFRFTLVGYEKQALADAETSEQLASLYLLTGNYFKAEKALLKSLEVKEAMLEAHSPLIIHACQELARLNLINGNYALCEQYIKKATEITQEVFGKISLKYSECLLIYAQYYSAIGDLKKAEDACLEADNIEVKKWGKSNLRRAEILSRLAFIRFKAGSYKTAEIDKLYAEASSIIKNALGTDNPLYATLIQKQAEFYTSTGNSDKADKLLGEADKFWTSKLGQTNRYSAEIELLRGNIAYSKNLYDQAEKKYQRSRSLYSNIFNEDHPLYIQASGKLARVYYMQKKTDKSLDVMEDIIPKYLNYISNYFPSLSFREKSKFWNNIKEEFEFYNFIALCVDKEKNPKLAGNAYNNIIATKALLLTSNIKIRQSILSSKDTVLIELFNEWLSQKEYLTNILSFTKLQLEEQGIDIKYIQSHIERLEIEISKRSEMFNDQEKKHKVTWKDIKDALKGNEYATEILRLRYFNKTFTDSVIYAAFIINNKSNDFPEVVLYRDGKNMEKKNFNFYRNAAIRKVKDSKSYQAYWSPIKEKIPDGSTVYLSLDGVYNQINIEMMMNEAGEYAIDKNQIVYVTNTKDLLNTAIVKNKKESARDSKKENYGNYILCGNPVFYTGEVAVQDKSIVSLPGAEKEINEIDLLLVQSGKDPVKMLNEAVSEDTLHYFKNPKVLHIATHGFFKEDDDNSSDDELLSNPLLNSGIILYGGGDIVDHPENNYVNMKSGILTAYEAMNLNFDKTELVVLSACETGLGEVQEGEGVYGLQRSFLIAGADAVIMSLFKVNDEVTQKLMYLFYQKWLKTGDKRKSFIEAKREIKKEYDTPIYWGAFIMIEGRPAGNVVEKF